MQNVELTVEVLGAAPERWGLRIAMDDFGTGHASLNLPEAVPARLR